MLKCGSDMDVKEWRALSLQITRGSKLRCKAIGEENNKSESNKGKMEEGMLKKASNILMKKQQQQQQQQGRWRGRQCRQEKEEGIVSVGIHEAWRGVPVDAGKR